MLKSMLSIAVVAFALTVGSAAPASAPMKLVGVEMTRLQDGDPIDLTDCEIQCLLICQKLGGPGCDIDCMGVTCAYEPGKRNERFSL